MHTWAYIFAGEALLEVGVGGNYISKARNLLVNSGIFDKNENLKEINSIQNIIVGILSEVKRYAPGGKQAEPVISAIGVGFIAQGGNLQITNQEIIAPLIKMVNPTYYYQNIERNTQPSNFGGAGAGGKW